MKIMAFVFFKEKIITSRICLFMMIIGVSFVFLSGVNPVDPDEKEKDGDVILKSGDTRVIKDQATLNIEFDYSQLKIGTYNSEEEYVDERVKKLNDKQVGRGDTWKEIWAQSKGRDFEPKFIMLMNKTFIDKNVKTIFREGATKARYTLIVRTTHIDPGFINIESVINYATAAFEYEFVETESRIPVSNLYHNRVLGYTAKAPAGYRHKGPEYDAILRAAESYAKGAKMLAGFLIKDWKKK